MTDRTTRLLRWIRRATVFVVGGTVTLFGVLLVVTPGPAIVVVPLGLMILATEFAWARVVLVWVKDRIRRMRGGAPDGTGQAPAAAPAEPSSTSGRPPDQV